MKCEEAFMIAHVRVWQKGEHWLSNGKKRQIENWGAAKILVEELLLAREPAEEDLENAEMKTHSHEYKHILFHSIAHSRDIPIGGSPFLHLPPLQLFYDNTFEW